VKKNFSIHDIARELKVSATTISFVLNGGSQGKKVSEPVRTKILDYVQSIGYKPNQVARSLRTGKSRIIGMLVEDISDPFFSSIGRIIEDSLFGHGYKIFHSSTDNNTARSKDLLRIFRERQVDGYIIAPSPGIESDIQHILNDARPVVLFDRFFPGLDTTNVIIDNAGGTCKAATHLIANGFISIAFITIDSEQVQMMDRLKGYNHAMTEHKLPSLILKIKYAEYKSAPAKIAARVKEFLTSNESVDALLFATNYIAICGLQAIRELGLEIPHDIGVVGFDDNTNFSLFTPTITAVAQPVSEISRQTVFQLISALTEEETIKKGKTIVLETELIIRESSLRNNEINNIKNKRVLIK
jgi:LacI family transcriptional regulator